MEAADSELKDDFFDIKATNNQEKINIIAELKEKEKSMPINVATPLPPLSLSQTGNIWPIKTDIADKEAKTGEYSIIIKTGKNPLKISKINVKRAKTLLPERKTLVVPILPEPISLISLFVKYLVNKKPKGIDPIK